MQGWKCFLKAITYRAEFLAIICRIMLELYGLIELQMFLASFDATAETVGVELDFWGRLECKSPKAALSSNFTDFHFEKLAMNLSRNVGLQGFFN